MDILKNTIKIYLENSIILLSNRLKYLTDTTVIIGNYRGLEQTIADILCNNIKQTYLFASENPKETINNLKKTFNYLQAAGGIVTNELKEYLLIHRRNLWDLPKGKVEIKEDLQTAAIREVKEETGVIINKILRFETSTWHCYLSDNQIIIKETYWYAMNANKQKVHPQLEEEITQVLWASKYKAKKLIAENSFQLVIDLMSSYLDSK